MASSDGSIVDGAAEHMLRATFMRCWSHFAVVDVRTNADLKPRGRKARGLLAFLALHPDRQFSRERITGLLWGDRAEEQARASLRQTIFELKAFANPARHLLTITRDHLQLNGAALLTDIAQMNHRADDDDYAALLSLLPDPDDRLFADLDGMDTAFDDWLTVERTRQKDALISLVAEASTAAAAQGKAAQARALDIRLGEYGAFKPMPNAPKGQAEFAATPVAHTPAEPHTVADGEGRPRKWRTALFVSAPVIASALALGAWQFRSSPNGAPTTIAVLPFKDMSDGRNGYFVDGVSEEILGQLSRNPRLKVMGRTSAWSFKGMALDAPTLGRRLDVAYLVEGSVRSSPTEVRIDVALVRAADGVQLWSDRYTGPLGEVFAIQDKIGAAVARRLDTGGSPEVAPNRALLTRGDVYSLYLTSRGLIRDRELAKMDAAVDLLRRAVKLDPAFAPAQANLGLALHFQLGFMYSPSFSKSKYDAINAEALAHVRHALRLAPELADAHLALGVVLAGVKDAKGASRQAIERAAQLDPNNAEVWNILAQTYEREGEFSRSLDAWRRAVAIDPLWWPVFYNAAETAWEMGLHGESVHIARRVEKDGVPLPFMAHMVRSDMAWRRGDFSVAYREARAASVAAEEGRRLFPDMATGRTLRALGYFPEARRIWRFYPVDDAMWGMWKNTAPPIEYLRALNADPARAWSHDGTAMIFVLRTLVTSGRSREAVALYDSRFKTLDAMVRHPNGHAAFLQDAVPVALALRNVGRTADSAVLLALADAEIRKRTNQGRVPRDYLALCAQVWAVMEDRPKALSTLEQLLSTGWAYNKSYDSLPDIGDEPAFRSLRGNPRFERVRAALRSTIERERRELGAISL